MPKTRKQQIERSWRHFNGTVNDKCEAGIAYRDFEPADCIGLFKVLPCIKDNVAPGPCSACSFPTEDEVQAELYEYKRHDKGMRKARAAIVADAGPYNPGEGKSGRITCPVCSTGTLSYTRAGINGHVHARCSTPGCLSWVE